jgi:hypothetical protein
MVSVLMVSEGCGVEIFPEVRRCARVELVLFLQKRSFVKMTLRISLPDQPFGGNE